MVPARKQYPHMKRVGGGKFKWMASHFLLSNFLYFHFLWRVEDEIKVVFELILENHSRATFWAYNLAYWSARNTLVLSARLGHFGRRVLRERWRLCIASKWNTWVIILENHSRATFWAHNLAYWSARNIWVPSAREVGHLGLDNCQYQTKFSSWFRLRKERETFGI
jgi:hypothetical protein